MQTTTIEADGAVLDCALVPWDSNSFGVPVAQISRIELGAAAATDHILREFETWCAARAVRFVSCRLDHARLAESIALEGLGFRFIEMVYEPHLDSLASLAAPRLPVEVVAAERADLPDIEAIAYDAFSTGRFLLDPRLPGDLSRRRYATWVRTSFDTPGQTVLKAMVDGELAGFFIVEPSPDRRVYWHLTAVAPAWQGQGVGRSLWQTVLIRHRDEGASSVATTISGHNVAALNLYARLGFAFRSPQMTFHWLREPA